LYTDALTSLEQRMFVDIKVDGFGAIDTDDQEATDGYFVVKWTGKPYPLQEEALVEHCEYPMKPGTLVCKGICWDRVSYAKGWYEPPLDTEEYRPQERLFYLRQVIHADIPVCAYNPSSASSKPGRHAYLRPHNQTTANRMKLKQIDEHTMNYIDFEKDMRSRYEMLPCVYEDEEAEMERMEEEREKVQPIWDEDDFEGLL
jgi:hypothetical protein